MDALARTIDALCEQHEMDIRALRRGRWRAALAHSCAAWRSSGRSIPRRRRARLRGDARGISTGTRRPSAREEHQMTSAATQSALSPAASEGASGRDPRPRQLVARAAGRAAAVPPPGSARARRRALALLPRDARARCARRPLAELPTLSKPVLMEHFDRIVTDPALGARRARSVSRRCSPWCRVPRRVSRLRDLGCDRHPRPVRLLARGVRPLDRRRPGGARAGGRDPGDAA